MASVELATGMGKVQHHDKRIGPNSPELCSMGRQLAVSKVLIECDPNS